jgi:hypothetical protein
MMKEMLKAMSEAARGLWRNRRVGLLLAGLYVALLGVLYLFISTREASVWQVLLTLIFAVLAPLLFFVLQAVAVGYSQGETKARVLLRRSFGDSCKLALASLPLILPAAVSVYLLNRFQLHSQIVLKIITPVSPLLALRWLASAGETRQWSPVLMATLRFLVFGIVLPLLAIHLWSGTLRDGLLPTLRRAHRTPALALSPPSLLIYTLGLTLFAIIPYFLLFGHTYAAHAWLEITLLVTRLLLIFLFTVYGWTITVSALNQRMKDE